MSQQADKPTLKEIFFVALRLGLTSFGGPIAHIGFFQNEYVERRKWIDADQFMDLVALAQFLPGPSSSKVGIGIGTLKAGPLGGFMAWLGFTLPSAFIMYLFSFIVKWVDVTESAWLHGLKIVALVIVSQAILSMGRQLANSLQTGTIAMISAMLILLIPSPYTQILVIAAAGLVGYLVCQGKATAFSGPTDETVIGKNFSHVCLVLFVFLLFFLSTVMTWMPKNPLTLFATFFQTGALVFGGGHVVLPLLEGQLVPTGWVSPDVFLAGYGAAQAIPGPLVSFAAYLGSAISGVLGALLALIAIFLPSFLLLFGVMPYWQRLRVNQKARAVLTGINASVVGLLAAAFYQPLWTTAILSAKDFALALFLFLLLFYWKKPSWVVVIAGALGAMLLAL